MFKLLGSLDTSLAIDLGTRNILISNKQKICFKQQTVAAYAVSSNKRKFIVGDMAEEIYETDPSHYEVIKPVNKGVICDFDHCREIISYALKSVFGRSFRKPGVLVSVPLDVTEVERAAFKEVLQRLSYAHVEMIPEPTAAAVGLVPKFVRKKGILLIDVGAGISECVVFSMGGIVCNGSIRLGGEDFESEIKGYIKKHYDFEIGNRAALRLLEIISKDHADSYLEPLEVKGFDLHRRMPSTLKLELKDIHHCLDSLYFQIVRCCLRVLEKCPEELSADIIENGIYLTGGASQSRRLIELLEKHSNLQVVPDAHALLGVARGEVALLQNELLRKQLLCA